MTRTPTLQYHDKILILGAYGIGLQWDMFWAIALIPSTKDTSPRGRKLNQGGANLAPLQDKFNINQLPLNLTDRCTAIKQHHNR